MSGNEITICGNLSRAPEARFTSSGTATCTLGVAVNRKWKNRTTGEDEESVSFFNVVAWQNLADNVCETLDKGDRVIVTGRLEQRSYETAEGDKRSVVEIIADDIGPSLRWATAKVEKAERSDSGGHSSRPARNEPQPSSQDIAEEPF